MDNIKPDMSKSKMKTDVKPKPPGYLGTGSGYAATTATVNTPTEKGLQVPNADAAKMFKPGNTIIHSGTQFTVTDANQNSPEAKAFQKYIQGTA
jgi:hypothetical protein